MTKRAPLPLADAKVRQGEGEGRRWLPRREATQAMGACAPRQAACGQGIGCGGGSDLGHCSCRGHGTAIQAACSPLKGMGWGRFEGLALRRATTCTRGTFGGLAMGKPHTGRADRKVCERQVTAGVFLLWLGVVALSVRAGTLEGEPWLASVALRTVIAAMIWVLSLYVVRKHAAEAQAPFRLEFLTPEELAERIAADLREMGFVTRVVASGGANLDSSTDDAGEEAGVQEALATVSGTPCARDSRSGSSHLA